MDCPPGPTPHLRRALRWFTTHLLSLTYVMRVCSTPESLCEPSEHKLASHLFLKRGEGPLPRRLWQRVDWTGIPTTDQEYEVLRANDALTLAAGAPPPNLLGNRASCLVDSPDGWTLAKQVVALRPWDRPAANDSAPP